MRREINLPNQAKLDKLKKNGTNFQSPKTVLKEGSEMEDRENMGVAPDANALGKNPDRYKKVYPNDEAHMRENPTRSFMHLNSAEMVALAANS